MVNIRATLERAESEGIVTLETRQELVALAKRRYYPERGYTQLLADGAREGLVAGELAALEAWLPGKKVDRKKEDALEMLRAILQLMEQYPGPKEVTFRFQHTDVWDQMARRTGRQLGAALPAQLPSETILDELRLDGASLGAALGGALTRGLALREAGRLDLQVGRDLLRGAMGEFCAERGLLGAEQVQAWMARQQLDEEGLLAFMNSEAKVRWVTTMAGGETRSQLLDHLRATGDFGRLSERAEAKRRRKAFWVV